MRLPTRSRTPESLPRVMRMTGVRHGGCLTGCLTPARERSLSMRLMPILCCALTILPTPRRAEASAAGMQTPLKTFASAKWGIALEYPATWSVVDDGDEVTFRG